MIRSASLLTALMIVAGTWLAASSSPDTPDREHSLRGARPVVEATRYASLQAALDAVSEGGGVVRIPAGTFEIREPLIITHAADVLVEGAGTATHIKNVNTDGQPALVIRPKGRSRDRASRQWRMQLVDLRITGTENSGDGILADNVNEIFIHGVTVSDHGGDGIRLDHCRENPRLSNLNVTYNKGTGLHLIGCHDIVVSGSHFEENQDALHCIDGFNLCMAGNCVDDHLGHGVVIENSYGSVLSGNMIEQCDGTALILDRDCYGITLSANVFAHNGAGIDLRDAHGCAVSGNTFTRLKTDALRIGPNSGRITVTGNNFSNSHIGDGRVKLGQNDLGAGMVLEGTSDVAISGNVFASVRPKAVELRGAPSRRILFANNVQTDAESDLPVSGANVDSPFGR